MQSAHHGEPKLYRRQIVESSKLGLLHTRQIHHYQHEMTRF